jgi:hypothetical protein
MHLELRKITGQCWNVEKLLKYDKSGDDDTAAKEKAQHLITDDSELLKALINEQPELYNKSVMIKFMLEKVPHTPQLVVVLHFFGAFG